MQTFFNLLTVSLLSILLFLNVFEYLKPKIGEVVKSQARTGEIYSLTLEGYPEVLNTLLEKNFSFSYIDGKVYLTLRSKEKFEKILKIYRQLKAREKKLHLASAAIKPLIEEDIATAKKTLEKLKADYNRLKDVLQAQNMVPDFSSLKGLVVEKEKETFEGWTKYWDLKREQIINDFKNPVEEPQINLADLEAKAVQFFGNELQVKLFDLYLKIKIFETRLEADTFKLETYED